MVRVAVGYTFTLSMGRSKDKGDKPHAWEDSDYPFGKRQRKRKAVSSEQFEVTGQHVVLFVSILFAAAWFAGLLPDP